MGADVWVVVDFVIKKKLFSNIIFKMLPNTRKYFSFSKIFSPENILHSENILH